MKVINLIEVLYPTTEIKFFNSSGKLLCFCEDILDIPADFWHREIDQISTNEEEILEIFLK